jgi:hypothetical protein
MQLWFIPPATKVLILRSGHSPALLKIFFNKQAVLGEIGSRES